MYLPDGLFLVPIKEGLSELSRLGTGQCGGRHGEDLGVMRMASEDIAKLRS